MEIETGNDHTLWMCKMCTQIVRGGGSEKHKNNLNGELAIWSNGEGKKKNKTHWLGETKAAKPMFYVVGQGV